jgi:Endonuclease/Exonuclease/phosphatase family
MPMSNRALAAFLSLSLGFAAGANAQEPINKVRFATFNASLNRDSAGKLIEDLTSPSDPQAQNVAEIIQRAAPDVLLINEFDYDSDGRAASLFQFNYLAISQHDAPAIIYPFRYVPTVNTGVASQVDLDGDGRVETTPGSRGYGNDALGFGQFPGQYGMVVYSKFPIQQSQVRAFGEVLWKNVPRALLPTKAVGSSWYSSDALKVMRLSSKNHCDVPITIGDRTIHVLASHPTPPAFDGPEHRNVKRNHDEIRLWADYLTGGAIAQYLGSPSPPKTFVLMGDQNADPIDGASVPGAIDQLLKHARINAAFVPRSDGAFEASRLQAGANASHKGNGELDTADFDDRSVGNLRVDYVLPSRDLKVLGGAVFWPKKDDPLSRLVAMTPSVASSDHRLVYIDVEVAPAKK